MLEPLAERTVIMGNSGSGKSTLAEAIASLVHIPVIDLDLLHWEQDGYGAKRNEDVARQMALDVFKPAALDHRRRVWVACGDRPSQGNGTCLVRFSVESLPFRATRSRATARSNQSLRRRPDEMGRSLLESADTKFVC